MFPQQPNVKKGDSSLDFPGDRIESYEEVITRQLNMYRERFINAVASFHEAMGRRDEDASQVINTAGGARSITSICEMRLPVLKEYRSIVKSLEKMLEALKSGDEGLELMWDDKNLVIPMFDPASLKEPK